MDAALEPLGLDVGSAARLAGLGRGTMYGLVMSGEISSFKVGARRIVPVASVREWMERQLEAAQR